MVSQLPYVTQYSQSNADGHTEESQHRTNDIWTKKIESMIFLMCVILSFLNQNAIKQYQKGNIRLRNPIGMRLRINNREESTIA